MNDSFTYTYTLQDGDTISTDTANLTVNVLDDVPVITSIQSGVLDNVAGLSYTGHIDAIPGADGIAAYHFDTANISAPTGVTYQYSADNTLITATDGTGETVFTVQLNVDGSYDFDLFKAAPETIVITPPFDSIKDEVDNHSAQFTMNLYSSYDASGNGIGDPVGTVTFTPYDDGVPRLSVSQDGLGVNNNLMNTHEVMMMAFDTPVTNATFEIGNFSNGDVLQWKVYDTDGTTLLDSGTIEGGYYNTAGVWIPLTNESIDHSIDLTHNGLDAGLQFSSMSIEALHDSNDKDTAFKFTGFSVEKAITVEDQHYDFSVVAIDGDGDISNSSSFAVTVDGTGSILTGTAADEVFTGGSGADTFLTGGGDDHIADYTKSLTENDIVDITSVLNSAADDHSKLGFSTTSDGKAVLEIYNSSDHSAANLVSTVTFDNITDATDLNSLLGKVDIDHTT